MSGRAESYFEREIECCDEDGRLVLYRGDNKEHVTLSIDDSDYAPGPKRVHVSRADLQALLDAYPDGAE